MSAKKNIFTILVTLHLKDLFYEIIFYLNGMQDSTRKYSRRVKKNYKNNYKVIFYYSYFLD